MTSLDHHPGHPSLWHLIEERVSNLLCRLFRPACGRRLNQRDGVNPVPHRDQQHFGSLDDQLLHDLGLQRSDIRAAEYGILPGDQALHHDEDADLRNDEAGSEPRSQA